MRVLGDGKVYVSDGAASAAPIDGVTSGPVESAWNTRRAHARTLTATTQRRRATLLTENSIYKLHFVIVYGNK